LVPLSVNGPGFDARIPTTSAAGRSKRVMRGG
jgi:hypothetical protein